MVERMVAPPKFHVLLSKPCRNDILNGKMNFAKVIKENGKYREKHLELFWWAECNHKDL